MSRFELRVLRWSWGLRVDVGLAAHLSADIPPDGIPVGPRLWLVIAPSAEVSTEDVQHLVQGLRRVAPRFKTSLAADGADLVFLLDHLWYPETDFQSGALELAVAGWAASELDLEQEPAAVSFDRAANRYVIAHNEDIWGTGS